MRISYRARLKALAARAVRRVARPGSRVVVLCYHSVHPHKRFASATPELFQRQVEWLVDNCHIIPFGVSLLERARGSNLRPTVAITFDDGYEDNYRFAFPVISRFRVPVTLFVCTGLVEQDPRVLARFRDLRSCSPEDLLPLTWSQLREMRSHGVAIGAHTYGHPCLARVGRRRAYAELVLAKTLIEEHLGERIEHMAYPFGKPRVHFTGETISLAAKAGYQCAAAVAFRSVRPSDSLYAIPRFFVTGDSVRTLADKVLGAWDLVGLWNERAPLWAMRFVSPEDFRV